MNSDKTKKWVLPVILGAAGLLLLAGVLVFLTVIHPKMQVEKHLQAGEEYHAGEDDENAILSYKAALEIDPKNERAYLDLADAYESLADKYLDDKMPDEGVKTFKEGSECVREGASVTGSSLVRDRLTAFIGKETDFYEKADRVRIVIEMEKIAAGLQPVMDQIGELAYAGKWDEVFEYMKSEEYEDFLKEKEKLEDKWIFKTKRGQIGFYKVNSEKYGKYMLYFGYYTADGKRDGKGDWFGSYCGNNYHAQGPWVEDVPQGYWKIKEWNGDLNLRVDYRAITGNVVDGLLDGDVEWSFNYNDGMGLLMRRCVFDHGKWVVTGPDKEGNYTSAAGRDKGLYLSPEEIEQIVGLVGYTE
ncbi:MAG: tetratricopeptide repeat protein [Lachnospiraceae bacterium]|nr:tetratricopeptide repeat protein [Lachnospiraceae bacterium]